MSRVKGGSKTRQRRKKILKLAKGYRGRRKNVFRVAYNAVVHALSYAYKHRKTKKRDFRSLFIQRINAGVREHGLSYSKFIYGIKKAKLDLDRKALSDLALYDKEAFDKVVLEVKSVL